MVLYFKTIFLAYIDSPTLIRMYASNCEVDSFATGISQIIPMNHHSVTSQGGRES